MRTPRLSSAALLAGVVCLGACQETPRILHTPIQPLREAELECSGRYERSGFAPLADDGSAPIEKPTGVRAELAWFSVPRELAAQLVGAEHATLWSSVVPRSEATRLWRSMPMVMHLFRSSLDLCADGPSFTTWEKETAFITDFELHTRPSAAMLDPVIEKMRSGLRVWMEPARGAEAPDAGTAARASSFTLRIEQLALQHPIPVATVPPLAGEFDISIQTPIFRRVDLSSRAALDYDEALVIVGPSAHAADQVFVATLTLTPSTPAPAESRVVMAGE